MPRLLSRQIVNIFIHALYFCRYFTLSMKRENKIKLNLLYQHFMKETLWHYLKIWHFRNEFCKALQLQVLWNGFFISSDHQYPAKTIFFQLCLFTNGYYSLRICDGICYIKSKLLSILWKPPSLNLLTAVIFGMELMHLGSEASIYCMEFSLSIPVQFLLI